MSLVIRNGLQLKGDLPVGEGDPLLSVDEGSGVVQKQDSIPGGSGNPFPDNETLIKGAEDDTKQAIFSLEDVTTGTTRTYKLPDADGTIALVGDADVFTEDVTLVLSGGKTFGKYSNGETAPWTGLTAREALLDAMIEYIAPVFSSFSVTGQSTTVEVGTTISGDKTFTWGITLNSGDVTTISIYDVTNAGNLVTDTPNDGTQLVTVNTNQLNSTGATQQWRGIGKDDNTESTFNSSTFTVTARFYRFFGPTSSSPNDSATVRALPSSVFHTGASTFTLNTGTTETKFVVALPPSVTISSVIDLDALNANITDEYVLTGTVNVVDAGGTLRAYNIYEMNIGATYSSSHRHQITTAN